MDATGSSTPSVSPGCAICTDSKALKGHPLARTACTPTPHHFHLKCISQWLDQQGGALDKRTCHECNQPALPLIRKSGATKTHKKNPYCESRALQACRSGDLKTLTQLLKSDPGIADQKFRSAITGEKVTLPYIAAQNGHTECLQTLISKEANINAAIKDNVAPLDCLQELIDAGPDINIEEENAVTPLYIAAQNGNIACLQALIDAGAYINNFNTVEGTSVTSLHIAAQNGHTECLQALLDATKDSGYVNTYINSEETGVKSLHISAQNGHTDCLQALINICVNITDAATIKDGLTPLHMAARSGHTDCLLALIGDKANIDATTKGGLTPLHMATVEGHRECQQTLINAGAADI